MGRPSKKQTEKGIEKKSFNLSDFKQSQNITSQVGEKELSWIPLSEAFHEALSLPGAPRGYFTSFRGYSNTGKSTAIYEAVVGCQKIGDLAIIVETEGNWNWEHARNIGVKFDEIIDEYGNKTYDGDFIFITGDDLVKRYAKYDYASSKYVTKELRSVPILEDVAMFMTDLMDAQREGELPRDLCFMWDSVGSLDCFKSVMSKSSNNQWNAGAMESAFKSIVNYRIPSSRLLDKEYTNTFLVVQKIWMDNENKVIKHKGGEAFFYSPRIIVHYGGILSHGTIKLKATSGGSEYQFGIETKIKCEKNQVNGVEKKGSICSTPHGYCSPDKIDEYKKENRDYILKQLGSEYTDFEVVKEEGKLSDDDMNN